MLLPSGVSTAVLWAHPSVRKLSQPALSRWVHVRPHQPLQLGDAVGAHWQRSALDQHECARHTTLLSDRQTDRQTGCNRRHGPQRSNCSVVHGSVNGRWYRLCAVSA
jgi:hypothetical protein